MSSTAGALAVVRLGVDEHELPARVRHHHRPDRHRHARRRRRRRRSRPRRAVPMTCASISALRAAETSTIVSTPSRGDLAHLGRHVLGPVVDDVVGPGRGRELGLLRAAHRRDDARVGPPGQLDRRVADRAGPALDQHHPAGQRARVEPVRHRPRRRSGSGARSGTARRGRRPARSDAFAGSSTARPRHHRVLGGGPPTAAGRPPPRATPARRSAAGSTPLPTASTTPAPSWSGIWTAGRDRAVAPALFQSVGFTPDAATRTRTSPGPGSGTGRSTSSRTSGSPLRV